MERNYELLKEVLSVPTKTYQEERMVQFITNWLTENNILFMLTKCQTFMQQNKPMKIYRIFLV